MKLVNTKEMPDSENIQSEITFNISIEEDVFELRNNVMVIGGHGVYITITHGDRYGKYYHDKNQYAFNFLVDLLVYNSKIKEIVQNILRIEELYHSESGEGVIIEWQKNILKDAMEVVSKREENK